MRILEIILIGIGLAMDAFAVAVCKGLSMKKLNWKKAIIIASYFGIFQAVMPMIGYFLGFTFESFVDQIDHWIAFLLLTIIGGNMVKESFSGESENCNDQVDFKTMVILAVATSMDALAVGVTFAFFRIHLLLAVFVIGLITFFLSLLGVKIGNQFGSQYENKAERIGGVILLLMGFRILLEHLEIF